MDPVQARHPALVLPRWFYWESTCSSDNSGVRRPIAQLDGVVLFFADDGTHGRELWRSDGTEGGTAMVKEIEPGVAGLNSVGSSALAETSAAVYFLVRSGPYDRELWKSDGTPEGTAQVRDTFPLPTTGRANFTFVEPTAIGTRLFFAVDHVDVGKKQICDSLPPRSMATCSMVGLLHVRLERGYSCGAYRGYRVRAEAGHFI